MHSIDVISNQVLGKQNVGEPDSIQWTAICTSNSLTHCSRYFCNLTETSENCLFCCKSNPWKEEEVIKCSNYDQQTKMWTPWTPIVINQAFYVRKCHCIVNINHWFREVFKIKHSNILKLLILNFSKLISKISLRDQKFKFIIILCFLHWTISIRWYLP